MVTLSRTNSVPETVIPETEEINRRNEQEGTLQSGVAIAGYHNLSEIGRQGIVSSPFLKSFVARIFAQFAEKVSTQLGDMSKKLDLLVARVASLERDVSDLRALASSNGAIASKGSLEKGVKVWRKMLDNETPFIEVGLTDLVQSKVLSICLCHLFVGKFKGESDRITDHAAHSLLALLFGLQKDKSKSSYQKGEGWLHADFRESQIKQIPRYLFVLSMIYNVQRNRSGQFVDDAGVSSLKDPSQNDSFLSHNLKKISESSHGRVSANHAIANIRDRPVQPRWLRLGFIKVEDLSVARRHACRNRRQCHPGFSTVETPGTTVFCRTAK